MGVTASLQSYTDVDWREAGCGMCAGGKLSLQDDHLSLQVNNPEIHQGPSLLTGSYLATKFLKVVAKAFI